MRDRDGAFAVLTAEPGNLLGARLNPYADARLDSRPDVRESVKIPGDLVNDFDLDLKPRPPLLLPPHPPFS